MDSQVRKRKGGKGVGKEKDFKDLTDKLGNIIPTRRDGVSNVFFSLVKRNVHFNKFCFYNYFYFV